MEIKYKKSLSSYKYLVMFDLASNITGICFWDIFLKKPISTQIIKTSGKFKTESLYNELSSYFDGIFSSGINKSDLLVYKEAMPSQLRGGSSTIQTFVSLAKSHAILNLFLLQNDIDFYDDIGVYPASSRAYMRKILGCDSRDVTKQVIHDYVVSRYFLNDISLDESDAVFLAMTFINVKWDNDLLAEVREIKKHKKSLVSPTAKQECDKKIAFLLSLKSEHIGG